MTLSAPAIAALRPGTAARLPEPADVGKAAHQVAQREQQGDQVRGGEKVRARQLQGRRAPTHERCDHQGTSSPSAPPPAGAGSCSLSSGTLSAAGGLAPPSSCKVPRGPMMTSVTHLSWPDGSVHLRVRRLPSITTCL